MGEIVLESWLSSLGTCCTSENVGLIASTQSFVFVFVIVIPGDPVGSCDLVGHAVHIYMQAKH